MSIFIDAVKSAFDVCVSLGLTINGQCVAVTSTQYNNAGDDQYTDQEQLDNVTFVQYDFEESQINGNSVKQGDTRFMVQESELNQNTYSHIILNSQKWSVVSAKTEPSNSIKIFHCRLQNG